MVTPREQVAEFHQAFAAHLSSFQLFLVYVRLVTEESDELVDALTDGSRPAIAQELADLKYVALGLERAVEALASEQGIDLDAAITAVHAANMSKRQPDGSVLYREDGKVMKSQNYRPPDMTEALIR
jgi:predicted HAD superfamily Cof-like phosphohydrolase